jgi:hypothetical protein
LARYSHSQANDRQELPVPTQRRQPRVYLVAAAAAVGAIVLLSGTAIALVAAGDRAHTSAVPAGAGAQGLVSGTTERLTAPAAIATAPVPVPAPVETAPPVAAAAETPMPSLVAYRGLGTWVDIYDTAAWDNPARAVRDMASHGVRTIFVETGNSGSGPGLFRPASLETLVREAHANNMLVVAWYLPTMKKPDFDYARIAEAIAYRTTDGQSFDSFALDIESGAVKPVRKRNAELAQLTSRIRALVGPSYPLGAIIPSPVGLSRKRGYWNGFPYTAVAAAYDVVLPMGYYSYHGDGASAAYADAVGNVKVLRAQPGCDSEPVHLIGGLAQKSTPAEVREFVRATNDTGCVGAGIYDWSGTTAAMWRALANVPR